MMWFDDPSQACEPDAWATRAGYLRHLYHDEEPCPECRLANAEYQQAYMTVWRMASV